MTRRGSGTSVAALLILVLSLVLVAPAWAQGSDEPVSSEDPVPVGPGPEPSRASPVEPGSGSSSEPSTREATATDNCDPNYEGACLDPDAEDYDCEGGGGNGPEFVRAPVEVIGEDRFGLDTDDPDNIACEESLSGDSAGGGGDTDDEGTPSGGIDSGYGPVAPQREADAPLPLGFVGAGIGALALLGLGVGRLRRAG